ncbi:MULTISPECIES: leucyl/phenylalanyl-tRNA--protein transferase [unclassified Wenzhouxiangella]|uniref:leucyl/phenylalanyl-tRNA--protein transferase n=1 Tax=unclassified Wenzhouxiangella TaxID=2613841 RepID=UPI000E32C636|nr:MULTISPECIES: leucyl/phenylalanyl-tRNA--protein transferase [unclassified Wenzhouxiangella]RFF28635.1 leucyl/phenylalanyl-tRNA--protein transferase [Wenzhouxiangella sp. 15181]RFP68950.1 leucyl/phenylalanyl-tRNA--protein transferase [Wenzhouxiangella sp. 15190]
MEAPVPQLGDSPESPFPDPLANPREDGLLAWGGDLHPTRLLNAYRQGIFPWYEAPGPVLWWSPEPRAVMLPGGMHLSRRFRRTLRQGRFRVTADRAFDEVVAACAAPRHEQDSTWITPQMRAAYGRLHALGHAHSIEIRDAESDELIGGLYGVAIGRIFFAESKFHRRRDASKIALAMLMRALSEWHFLLCDCQLWNPHLERLGVRMLSGELFQAAVARGVSEPARADDWKTAIEDVDFSRW